MGVPPMYIKDSYGKMGRSESETSRLGSPPAKAGASGQEVVIE